MITSLVVPCAGILNHRHNNYIISFKSAIENLPSINYNFVIDADGRPAGEHSRRFNAPATKEVATFIAGTVRDQRDIVLQQRVCTLKRIIVAEISLFSCFHLPRRTLTDGKITRIYIENRQTRNSI